MEGAETRRRGEKGREMGKIDLRLRVLMALDLGFWWMWIWVLMAADLGF